MKNGITLNKLSKIKGKLRNFASSSIISNEQLSLILEVYIRNLIHIGHIGNDVINRKQG
jgi:hypothetical protein